MLNCLKSVFTFSIKTQYFQFCWLVFIVVYSARGYTLSSEHPVSPKQSLMFSEKEAAAFALLVYHDNAQPPIPEGFHLLCSCPPTLQDKNYYAEAYYRLLYPRKTGPQDPSKPSGVLIVIAHRGTVLNFHNIADDFFIALKHAPIAFLKSSKKFTEYVNAMVYQKFPAQQGFLRYDFVHVGHSLGAIHAELNYISQQGRQIANTNTSAIVFESPGSKEIVEQLISTNKLPTYGLWQARDIKIINADINVINTFNQQVGAVKQITPGYDFLDIPKTNLSPLDIKYFSTYFTFDQHRIEKIYAYFNQSRDFSDPASFPVGIFAAFKYYKTYNPPANSAHRAYWDKALLNYWNNHPEIHRLYSHHEPTYHQYMIEHHLYSSTA